MEKRQEGLAPFSSDECPNSGEDSDEDVITDYLGSEITDCSHVSVVNGELARMNLDDGSHTNAEYTKDNPDIVMSETGEDQRHPDPPRFEVNIRNQNPLVPIISVTPHSPGLAKHYPVLEDNLQQLHEIHNSIQRMRDLTLCTLGYGNRLLQNEQLQRLSSSCPSLCPLSLSGIKGRTGDRGGPGPGSDPDLANCSTNSSPTHFPNNAAQLPPSMLGVDRRRSWTDLEETRHRHRCQVQNHLQAQNMRQRSISLSSLDSEMDLESDGKSRSPCAGVTNRSCRSQTSTHSLNEADLVQIDLQKLAVKRGNQRSTETSNLLPGVTGSRLPLQKSISTPSIITPPGQTLLAESGSRATPSLAARLERNEKGSGSETETEDLHTAHSHHHPFHEDLIRQDSANVQASLDELMTDGTAYDDQHSEKTRRKRGSLFFRKKKDKSGKKPSPQSHHWITMNTGTQGTVVCDICMKQLSNKTIIQCEICGATVHQNQACRDQASTECSKTKSTKGAIKSISNVSIASSVGHVKRGSTASLPPSSSSGTTKEITTKKTVTSYSPWRRVATKLGVNQIISEEKDGDTGHRDIVSGWEEFDFGDDVHLLTISDIEGLDPELKLGGDEPDSWSASIGRSEALRLVDNNDREVKRQEHIYEFVLTEKHHCLVLLAMDRIFAEGLRRHFRLGAADLERMFPRLRDLIDIHLRFLLKLRKRQSANPVVPTIADILVDQFSDENSSRMTSAYGEFCSRHRDAVDTYKYYLRLDARFARFVKLCQTNPLLKKKGIPECILFVTQRLTKYPLLVEPLIKTGTVNEEKENLRQALNLVKQILGDVDACVADKEREDRKLEIYNRIDAKSFAHHRGVKFKKSDLMAFNRVLKFEGTAYLMQGRGKMVPVTVVVLSDVLLFLAETRDQKYAFFVPDNKAGVVSLQKLLVREKAGQESRSIYVISSSPSEPEMFELKVQKPKDKHLWITAIRSAVEACPQDYENDALDEGSIGDIPGTRSSSASTLSIDERQRIAKAKETHILRIISELRKKDTEQALLLEEKMALQMRLVYEASEGNENDNEAEKTERNENTPDYTRLCRGDGSDSSQVWQEVVVAVQEATRLASSLSYGAGGGSLSRSLSSAGERHSEAYIPPALCIPRRAETFAGFDNNNKERYPWRDSAALHSVMTPPKTSEFVKETENKKEGDAHEVNRDQQLAAIRLSHYIYTLLCIISNQMTTIDSLHAQLAACKDGGGKSTNSRPNPNRQLEELRNLQDQLSREKAAFRAATQQERKELSEERAELTRLREQVAAEQLDVTNQRDQLYRRLEALERSGVVTTPTVCSNATHVSHVSQSSDTLQSRKSLPDAKRIPLNLISATNQQKAPSNLPPVKQQLPLKLASGTNNNSTRSASTGSNNSPDRHSRTSSSPAAVVTSSAYSSPELGHNHYLHHHQHQHQHQHHNNGNHSLLSLSSSLSPNRSARTTRSSAESYHQQPQPQQQQPLAPQPHQQRAEPQQPLEEEVIFF
ncbi:rho guanine nucleotide exchange factor 28 isoform X2 [Microplitis mediator]|uniref:rho guanine nucleotide exchange factor 28 isoform X2 n=1 Tax=Microplitis mediator TaxID=375433 RepID=UPI002556D0C4|nr:rho guanine nucleotide exchange factor 28 isoform X2 [Microplitis mediator]